MPSLTDLNANQRRMAELIAAGYSNPQIARTLGLSLAMVKNNVSLIYATLGLRGRMALVTWMNGTANRARLRPRLLVTTLDAGLAELMLATVATLQTDVEHTIAHNDADCERCRRALAAFDGALGEPAKRRIA